MAEQISLTGPTKAQTECNPHFFVIKAIHDINPVTGQRYGKNTPGTCTLSEEAQIGGCGLERMFDSSEAQAKKDDFSVEEHPPE